MLHDGISHPWSFRDEGLDQAIDRLRPLLGTDSLGIRVRITPERSELRLIELPSCASLSHAGGIESLTVVPGAVPEPYRRAPKDFGRAVSPLSDPAVVSRCIAEILPEAFAATEEELSAAEAELGRALPADLRALYLSAGSGAVVLSPEDDDLFYGFEIIALNDADTRAYLEPENRYLSWTFGATETVSATPHVQGLAVSPAWFAFGGDWGGNTYVVDLAPGPQGSYGQVLFVDHETSSGASWLAGSITELLTQRPVDFLDEARESRTLAVRHVAEVTGETEVLELTSGAEGIEALKGHPKLRTLTCDERLDAVESVADVPALEYLALTADDWLLLVAADRVPASLMAVGFTPRYGEVDIARQLEAADALLQHWGLPGISITELSVSRGPA